MKRLNLQPLYCGFYVFITCFFISETKGQTDSAISVGSTHFKANKGKIFWMGANYRKEWSTPIKAQIVDLNKMSGGLTPLRRGGGKQTRSLRVEDVNGRQYTFRTIEKFITAKTLPPDLQSQAAEDLVADGVSASYPYSTLSIPILSEAAGVPYNKVKLFYVPDDTRLGEYQHDFANRLALFEERIPEGINKVYDTYDVVMKLKEDNDDGIDQHAVLRARILDMFVMDLDRHEDQWQWGAIEKSKGKDYYPIPRDRDQAFFTNQGFIPGMIKRPWLLPQLEGFKAKAKNINRFNFAARNFDRFFLTELSEQDWKKEVDEFIPKMTDEVIEKALHEQPAEIRPFSADKIINNLKERRKYLAAEVMKYYRFLAETVSISGSDKKELFDITRNDDGSVLVQIYKITKEGEQSTKMYDRTFYPADTKEIRLYSFGGDDKFAIKGKNGKIKIRMIGGDGKDVFENKSSGGKNYVYDLKSDKNILDGKLKDKTSKDTAVNSYDRLGFKYDQIIPLLSANYNSDDGLFLGFSLKFINQGFRKTPYKNMHQIVFTKSLLTKSFNTRYYAEYIGVFGKNTDLLTDLDIKGRNNITSFYGYGANSVYDKSKPDKFKYYWAKYNTGDVGISLRHRFSDKISLIFGPAFQYYSLDSADNKDKYILKTNENGLDPATLFADQLYLGGKGTFIVDTRNNKVQPNRGIYWQTSYRLLVGMNTTSYEVRQMNSDFIFHLNIAPQKLTLVNRTGGGHNFGYNGSRPDLLPFEFYQAQYLGGEDNLRGYRKYRFAGRSKLYNNLELRWKLATFRTYLFPANFGIYGFYDTGRVWDDTNTSNKWLSGYGGGVWLSPLNRIVLTLSFTASKEDKIPTFSFGWKF
jgi:hypothetical protein